MSTLGEHIDSEAAATRNRHPLSIGLEFDPMSEGTRIVSERISRAEITALAEDPSLRQRVIEIVRSLVAD